MIEREGGREGEGKGVRCGEGGGGAAGGDGDSEVEGVRARRGDEAGLCRPGARAVGAGPKPPGAHS